MNHRRISRRLTVLLALSTAFMLYSCGEKPEETASPSPSLSAVPLKPSAKATAAASPSPSASASPVPEAKASVKASTPKTKPALSAEAEKLGTKPKDATTCPDTAPIKGNVTAKRGNIYHTTKSPDFAKVKPDICFKDTATAEKAGFRAPK